MGKDESSFGFLFLVLAIVFVIGVGFHLGQEINGTNQLHEQVTLMEKENQDLSSHVKRLQRSSMSEEEQFARVSEEVEILRLIVAARPAPQRKPLELCLASAE